MQLEKSQHHNEFDELGNEISDILELNIRHHFDIFVAILSNIIWQSPAELAIKLIAQVAPTQWQSLQSTANDNIEVKRKKERTRKGVLQYFAKIVYNLRKKQSLLQRFTTRLLVQETLSTMLPANDQDRIIAAELMFSFRNWKRLLSTMVTHDIMNEERYLVSQPFSYIDKNGKDTCILTVNDHIDPIDSIPDLPIEHNEIPVPIKIGPITLIASMNVSRLLIDEGTLIRHENNIPQPKDEHQIRTMILTMLGDVPVYKRMPIGNQKQKGEPQGEWKLHGIK